MLGGQNSRTMKSQFITKTAWGAILLGACLIPVVSLQADDSKPVNQLTKQEKKAGWQLLFDGRNLDQFRNYKKDAVGEGWAVEDGAITWKQKGAGDIITKEKFGAFELVLEYRISKGGNSGIMFHVTEEEKRPWQTGPEIQLQDNEHGHDPQKSGWLYQFYKSDIDATKPAGEWNEIRILMTPGKSVHWVNGKKYFEYVKHSEDWNEKLASSKFAKFPSFGKANRGHICLQDHGNAIAFRNIRIRPIESKW